MAGASDPVRLAVVGAGVIGRRHAATIAADPRAVLTAIGDPTDAGRSLAGLHGVPWTRDLTALLAGAAPEGIVVATPTRMHVANGLEAVAAGVPALIEKPVADDASEALVLVEAGEAAGVPLLVGHHRRHGAILQAAKAAIDAGRLGQVLTAHAQCWFRKPDAYFEPEWRRRPGAGPVLTNMIHDIDALRFLCGEVVSVQAAETDAGRGHMVEDTATALLRFASGALATLTVSDAVVAPWSWELTSGEDPAYPRQDAFCCLIGGTHGSLSLPSLDLFFNEAARDWHRPVLRERLTFAPVDPLAAQIADFRAVIRDGAKPRVPAREGLKSLAALDAVKRSARTGERVALAA